MRRSSIRDFLRDRGVELDVFDAGQTMHCCMCGAIERCDPLMESAWRCLVADGKRFYACPQHFPPDGSPASKFTAAYERILKTVKSRLEELEFAAGLRVTLRPYIARLRLDFPDVSAAELLEGMDLPSLQRQIMHAIGINDRDRRMVARVFKSTVESLVAEVCDRSHENGGSN